MTLNELRLRLTETAGGLGDFQALSKNELANGYCEADEKDDEVSMNAYWAAILLRYWHWIFKWKDNSVSLHPTDDDLFAWLHDAITDAFNYRSWRTKRRDAYAERDLKEKGIIQKVWIDNPQFVHDENAADKSINFFLGAKRGKMYQEANKHKRKVNVTTYSIDAMVDDNGDCALDYTGAVQEDNHSSGANDLICKFLHDGYGIEALIIDGIINYDSFKEIKKSHYEYDETVDEETGELVVNKEKVYDYSSTFDMRKLVKHLNSVNQEFMQSYFCEIYSLTDVEGDAILAKLKKLNNSKLYDYIKKTLIQIRQSPELLGFLIKN